MKVSELKTEMDSKFAAVDQRFERVDERFEQIDRRFERVDESLEELRRLVKSEGEATRRHFDVVADNIVSERNPCAGQIYGHGAAARLVSHIERR